MSEAPLIRTLGPGDSVDLLTDLIHSAYKNLGARGMNFTAVHQDVETTRSRIAGGECLLVETDGVIRGTVTWYRPGAISFGPWYGRPGVAVFAQLAVHPASQRAGLGSLLIEEVERRARAEGALQLALDTARPAVELIAFYERRGFHEVSTVRWPGKKYRSVILAKPLLITPEQ
jgi:GNAT superfamily N-acetyltransferase